MKVETRLKARPTLDLGKLTNRWKAAHIMSFPLAFTYNLDNEQLEMKGSSKRFPEGVYRSH